MIKQWKSLQMTQKEYSKWTKEQLIQRIQQLEQPGQKPRVLPVKKAQKQIDFTKYNKRFIALKFSYLGWNYNGLAIQKTATALPTVEGVIIKALNKCKLVNSENPSDFKFSRCGRTDKGVSALNQVISLQVRSNLTLEEQLDPGKDSEEIDYVKVLNGLLPPDIKFHSICLRPFQGFDSRFSCKSREYRYIFHKSSLDIFIMQKACDLYIGEHDFRNFCKIDGSKQIYNYKRTVMVSTIYPINEDYYVFQLEGTAFLWHQVRNMISVLFLIGQNLESIDIITQLLNDELYPTKPNFDIGSDLPLILYNVTYPPMEWQGNTINDKTHTEIYSNWLSLSLKETICKYMLELFPKAEDKEKIRINTGDGKGRVVGEYVPLGKRPRMESFEVVNERWRKKQKS